MNAVLLKHKIAHNFGKAANSYDQAAILQTTTAEHLFSMLPDSIAPQQVVDLGTGTGQHLLTLARRFPQAQVLGMDLSVEMLRFSQARSRQQANIVVCAGDIEQLPFRDDSVELMFSNLAIQWCDFATVLQQAHNALKPGGWFFFTTLVNESLMELNRAWQSVGEQGRVNDYPPFATLQQQLLQTHFRIQQFEQRAHTLHYHDVPNLLRSLKQLGVNTLTQASHKVMTRGALQQLTAHYETQRTTGGLPLTYQVLFAGLQKRERHG